MRKVLIRSVQGYQKYISPGLPRRCRYHPTCSQYMIDAIQMHGAVVGTTMGLARIARCHPFVKGGIDYVPDHFTVRRNKQEFYIDPLTKKAHRKE